jgi:hypothetical protein
MCEKEHWRKRRVMIKKKIIYMKKSEKKNAKG